MRGRKQSVAPSFEEGCERVVGKPGLQELRMTRIAVWIVLLSLRAGVRVEAERRKGDRRVGRQRP